MIGNRLKYTLQVCALNEDCRRKTCFGSSEDITRVCPAFTQRSYSDRAEFWEVLQTTARLRPHGFLVMFGERNKMMSRNCLA